MYQLYKDLAGYSLATKDDVFGGVSDIYFDDRRWQLRYLVAKTGSWLNSRDTLIDVRLIEQPDATALEWPVKLTRAQVEEAAEAETEPPVSAQRLSELSEHWASFMVFPADFAHPSLMSPEDLARLFGRELEGETQNSGDPNLRSIAEVKGYEIVARGESIGTVDDFLIDPAEWKIAYLVVDIGGWLPGKLVILPTEKIDDVSWLERSISMTLSKRDVEDSRALADLNGVDRPDQPAVYLNHGYAPI